MGSQARRVAVVLGGIGGERDVSRETGACVAAQLRAKYLVKPVEILNDGTWEVPDGFLGHGLSEGPGDWFCGEGKPILVSLARLVDEGIEVVFNALHGPGGEDGSFQGLLRHVGLPFTGPDVTPAAVTMDKRLTKEILLQADIRTPPFFTFTLHGDLRSGSQRELEETVRRQEERLSFPWVLKPVALGSSVGVEVLDDGDSFLRRVGELRERLASHEPNVPGHEFLVESWVKGRELSCGVIHTDRAPQPLPPIEIRPRESSFFDYRAKYTAGATEEICPAPLSGDETAAVQALATRVHELFRCEPLSRTDLFLGEDGLLTVLEINTLPGMTETSLIPLSAAKAGIPLDVLLVRLVEHGLRRGTHWSG